MKSFMLLKSTTKENGPDIMKKNLPRDKNKGLWRPVEWTNSEHLIDQVCKDWSERTDGLK